MNALFIKIGDIFREFTHLTLTVLPYFLLGAIVGAVLINFTPDKWTRFIFKRGNRFFSFLSTVTVAALLPGCSCATIPMAVGIKDGYAKPSIGIVGAFIFMSPLLSPITVILTWKMLGWEMTLARIIFSYTGSIGFGLLVDCVVKAELPQSKFSQPAVRTSVEKDCRPSCSPEVAFESGTRFKPFLVNLKSILRSIAPHFLLGMLIAAMLTTVLPEDGIPRVLGGASGIAAYLLAALVGIPLYVCEGEEVPITFALLERGLGVGPSFTFLLGSVGTCVPTMIMARKIIGDRATIIYAVFWVFFAISSGIVFQWILR